MKANRKPILALAGATLLATAAVAAPSVEVTNVQQQYPWTNTVDITYTVSGVKDFPAKTATGEYASNETYFVTFTATDTNGVAIKDVDGNTVFTNGLVNGNGANQIAKWNPALGQQLTACKITPSVFRGEDDAYLVINLETNAEGMCDWWFEPISCQSASNARYNTDEYKTKKMVLRKIPTGEHWIGHSEFAKAASNYGPNSPHKVVVPEGTCFYEAIFITTQAQYSRIIGKGAPSSSLIPKVSISWGTLRNSTTATAKLIPDAQDESSFLIRLAGLTGLDIDLPTDEMWEIAARAGSRGVYYWGDVMDNRYRQTSQTSVGTREPNAWGLYDTVGLDWEWVLDIGNKTDLAEKTTDIYTPVNTHLPGGISKCHIHRGSADEGGFYPKLSCRWWNSIPENSSYGRLGFRVACIFDKR